MIRCDFSSSSDVICERSLTDRNQKARQVYKEKNLFSELSYGLAFCYKLVVRCFDLISRSIIYFQIFGQYVLMDERKNLGRFTNRNFFLVETSKDF